MNKILLKSMAGVLAIAGLASCSSDYLNVEPETEIGTEQMGATVSGARLGMYGACRAMYSQYTGWDTYLSPNGEPWINNMFGEIMGSDYFSYLYTQVFGNDNYNWKGMNIQNGWMTSIAWRYCYGLIFKANAVLDSFPEEISPDDQNDYNMIEAQLLTIRAHAYTKLLQLYAPRWEDSNNGEEYCIVWREHAEQGDTPLVTMNKVKENLYRDLDRAIDLYNNTSVRRENIWEPCLEIAQGIYSRIALIVHDYPTAQKMAHDARQGIELMSNEAYHNGFNSPESSWLWANEGDFNGLWYWAWGSWFACNGAYPTLWPYGGPVIVYDLYKQMDSKDARRDLYWTPDKNSGPLARPAHFWNPDYIDASNMNMNSFPNQYTCKSLRSYCEEMIPNGDKNKYGVAYATMGNDGTPNFNDIMIFFGSHFKFWGTDTFGSDAMPFMRAEELLFNEAEAAYHNQDETTAKNCLNEINGIRIPGYSCKTSGDALLDEIRLSKRIELWGEGFCWYDLKRWNVEMHRSAWVEGDRNSGNIPSGFAITMQPEAYNGWRYNVPKVESDYNHAIDRSLLKGFGSDE